MHISADYDGRRGAQSVSERRMSMKIGHIERNYKMSLKEQLEILEEDYEGFQYLCVSCQKIHFMYERERECA